MPGRDDGLGVGDHAAKVMSMRDAVARFVHDGDTVVIEGFTHLICFAAGHEIIRQRRRDLTLRSEEHTSELQSQSNLVCRLLLAKKKENRTEFIFHAELQPRVGGWVTIGATAPFPSPFGANVGICTAFNLLPNTTSTLPIPVACV